LTPVPVVGLGDVIAIGASDNHSAALKRDGTVWTWGDGNAGQHGNGSTNGVRLTPGQVPGIVDALTLSAGAKRTLIARGSGASDGSLWGWGGGTGYLASSSIPGMLCDGAGATRATPVRTLDDVLAVEAGVGQSLLLRRADAGRASVWGCGYHNAKALDPDASSDLTAWPTRITEGDFIALAAGRTVSVLEREDTRLLVWWWAAGDRRGDGFTLGPSGGAGSADPDGDGLTTAQEWALGSDPFNADTNGDGISDGVAVTTGVSPTNPDQDADGVENAMEIARGTNPFAWDTDGDGHGDGDDAFPLDPTRWQAPTPTPGDQTPPVITLTEPTNAVLISSVP
jgi:alpha-tubulin suppressor-like RCC1 family protein